MTTHDMIRKRLLDQAGLGEPVKPAFTVEQMKALWDTEWVQEFENLMRNRFVMGALRYGTMAQNRRKKTKYDRVESCIKRLRKYQETGNLEFLIDVANLCMLEYDQSNHPNKHFSALDGDSADEMRVKKKDG